MINSMRSILDDLVSALAQGQDVVLAAVVRSSGSAPRASGARMLVRSDGSLVGSVGGGLLEGACLERARRILAGDGQYGTLQLHLDNSSAALDGMICGGQVEVLLQRVRPADTPLFLRLQAACRAGRRPVLLTFLPDETTAPQLVGLDGLAGDDVPADLRGIVMKNCGRLPFLCAHSGRELLVEPLAAPGVVHFAGAGHVALATAKLAHFAGFATVVMDDRAAFANHERFPHAEVRVLPSFDRCFDRLEPDDYAVIVTRGHLYDRQVLAQALRTEAGYIGMIGSRRKRDTIYASLLADGFTTGDLERVHCPIGISIEAETPEEIGVSIVAELIQARNAGPR